MQFSPTSRKVHNGFTLLEVVVGLVLMASLLVASLLSFSTHRKQLRLADARIAAASAADGLLETLMAQPDGLPKKGRGRVPGYPNWIWQTNLAGLTNPLGVAMYVIDFRIIEIRGDGSLQQLVSVKVVEAVP